MTVIGTSLNMWDFGYYCGFPGPSSTDLDAWNEVDKPSGSSATLTLGLFGYDISCWANLCSQAQDENSYCTLIQARGLDGLAFGVHISAEEASITDYYCVGLRDPEFGDKAVCFDNDGDVYGVWFYQYYTVTSDYFTADNPALFDSDFGYGLSTWAFYGWDYNYTFDTTFENSGFRFIGASENDGARYTVGDQIDVFYLDHVNSLYEDQPGFELTSASALAVGAGAALIASILM